jgi:UDPglucose--hexose-1-phosphate uridylyltransferase
MDETLQGFASSLRSLPMPELRKDPIVGRWVIIATDRAKRPVAPKLEMPNPDGFCPFCEGREEYTPNEILAYRDRNTARNQPGWRVRVVPNKFPALQIEGDLQKRGEVILLGMFGFGVK